VVGGGAGKLDGNAALAAEFGLADTGLSDALVAPAIAHSQANRHWLPVLIAAIGLLIVTASPSVIFRRAAPPAKTHHHWESLSRAARRQTTSSSTPWVTNQPQVPAEQQPSNPIRIPASRSAAVFTRRNEFSDDKPR
jgi:hypothetical protein